jgi:hypothetical protein
MATRARRARDFDGRFWQNETSSNYGAALCAALSSFLHHLACMHSYETSMQLCLWKKHKLHGYVRRSLATRDVSALAQPRSEAPGGHWQPQARFQPQRRALLQVVMLS